MTWLGRLRLRVIVLLVGVPLAVLGAVSIGPAWMTLPLVGVAFAAITLTVSKTAQRLGEMCCWTCGAELCVESTSEHGIVCAECGSLNQHFPARHSYAARIEHDSDEFGNGGSSAATMT